ncbi:hypothetical protein P3875_06025 [Myroides sp. JBRI-B21084]|uniref:hypothetical protein n=1 Tax=Myroides sp. JBRI-B21084 TaxID=3119977 RepID=UPI0026E1E365|nr:hypothetical protein [Paenimyroides cloacae]WKW47610.1 hypothetical protein P3875_06025 [Paenimyroides cloacae]
MDNLNYLVEFNVIDELSKNYRDFYQKSLNISEEFDDFFNYHIIKIIIPKELKRTIKRKIGELGIKTETVFPDMDGFCKSLASNCEAQTSSFKY